jgi:hypothetical protein
MSIEFWWFGPRASHISRGGSIIKLNGFAEAWWLTLFQNCFALFHFAQRQCAMNVYYQPGRALLFIPERFWP